VFCSLYIKIELIYVKHIQNILEYIKHIYVMLTSLVIIIYAEKKLCVQYSNFKILLPVVTLYASFMQKLSHDISKFQIA
jgi:hypothetical protein